HRRLRGRFRRARPGAHDVADPRRRAQRADPARRLRCAHVGGRAEERPDGRLPVSPVAAGDRCAGVVAHALLGLELAEWHRRPVELTIRSRRFGLTGAGTVMAATGSTGQMGETGAAPRVLPCGDAGLLVELSGLDEVLALHGALEDRPPAGVVDLVPAARTLLVRF